MQRSGMDTCPRCRGIRRWVLADRRRKCVDCKHRWTPLSVWDAVRTAEATKRQLLGRFVDSVPCYRDDGNDLVSFPSAAKFYRHARAICAMEQPGLQSQLPAVSPIVLSLTSRTGGGRGVSVRALEGRSAEMWHARAATRPTGELLRCDHESAVGALRLQQGKLVLSDVTALPPKSEEPFELVQFWRQLCAQLKERRHVPVSTLHLHIGEITFRWNHAASDLQALLESSMRSVQLSTVEPLLVRNR